MSNISLDEADDSNDDTSTSASPRDDTVQEKDPKSIKQELTNCQYLEDQSTTIYGLRVIFDAKLSLSHADHFCIKAVIWKKFPIFFVHMIWGY